MTDRFNRRVFLKTAAAGAGLALLPGLGSRATAQQAPAVLKGRRPNILFINADQLNCTALGAHGCAHVRTPNIDRLIGRGVTFAQSYTANPVCCPARSAWFSGRPGSETAGPGGSLLRPELPDLGQWLGARGYEPVYAGKWHVPGRDVARSFNYLNAGSGMGENTDGDVSRAGQGFLRNYSGDKPFFLTLGFLQPHDICYWLMRHTKPFAGLPYPELADELPPLPSNFNFDANEPAHLQGLRVGAGKESKRVAGWDELQWRYYLWSYYRHVEMVDAEVGRVLDALEDSRHAKDTMVVFSADHGEGMACHRMVIKGYLYDEASRVPLVASWPGHLPEGKVEQTLASGLDLAPTLCDYAGAEPMPKARGLSLRPLLEGRGAPERDFIAAEAMGGGHMIRTADAKFVCYDKEEACQLFDMKNDPGETRNLAAEAAHGESLAEMKRRFADWKSKLELGKGWSGDSNNEEPKARSQGKEPKALRQGEEGKPRRPRAERKRRQQA